MRSCCHLVMMPFDHVNISSCCFIVMVVSSCLHSSCVVMFYWRLVTGGAVHPIGGVDHRGVPYPQHHLDILSCWHTCHIDILSYWYLLMMVSIRVSWEAEPCIRSEQSTIEEHLPSRLINIWTSCRVVFLTCWHLVASTPCLVVVVIFSFRDRWSRASDRRNRPLKSILPSAPKLLTRPANCSKSPSGIGILQGSAIVPMMFGVSPPSLYCLVYRYAISHQSTIEEHLTLSFKDTDKTSEVLACGSSMW